MQRVCHVNKANRRKTLWVAGTPFLHGHVVFICALLPAHDSARGTCVLQRRIGASGIAGTCVAVKDAVEDAAVRFCCIAAFSAHHHILGEITMRTRFLTAALASTILSFGVGTAMAQTTAAPADNQGASTSAMAPMAGGEAAPAAGSSDTTKDTTKPTHKKPHHHKKSKAAEPGGTSSAGDMSHSGMQSGGNDAATSTGNAQPGSAKQSQ